MSQDTLRQRRRAGRVISLRSTSVRLGATALATAASLVGAIVEAPAPAIASLVYAPVPTAPVVDRPEWLTAPDIAVNPPGIVPGTVAPPPVDRGYVITGAHLHRFEITGTPEANEELRAFAARLAEHAGMVAFDPTSYRVFSPPSIIRVSQYQQVVIDAMQRAEEIAGQDIDGALTPTYSPPSPVVSPDVPTVKPLPTEPDSPIDLPSPSPSAPDPEPGVTVDPSAAPDVDPSPLPDPAVSPDPNVQPTQDVFNPSDSPEDIVGDVTHVGPGTDPVDDLSDGVLGDVFILPIGVGVGEIGAAFDEGRLMVTTMVEESPLASEAAPVTSTLQQPEQFDAEWDQQGQFCYSRKSNNTAWYDPCFQYASLAKDGIPYRKAWAHRQFGTAKSKGIWTLVKFNVAKKANPDGPEQRWLDWAPAADTEMGNCSSTTIGVNVNAAVLEHSTMQCDTWRIDKNNPEVRFFNTWDGKAWRKARNVAAITSTSVPDNTTPKNFARYDYYAY